MKNVPFYIMISTKLYIDACCTLAVCPSYVAEKLLHRYHMRVTVSNGMKKCVKTVKLDSVH